MRMQQRIRYLPVLALGCFCAGFLTTGCAGFPAQAARAESGAPSPLAPYLHACSLPGEMIGRNGFGVAQVSPPVRPHYRPVRFKDVEDSVSVREGHRLMYAFRDAGYYFANVKIERSDSASYPRDKDVIARQQRSIEDGYYEQRVLNGLEVHVSEADSLDFGGVIGVYTVFLDRESLILTAYLLNQGKKRRRFHSIEEFRDLRETFLRDLTACVATAVPADSAAP